MVKVKKAVSDAEGEYQLGIMNNSRYLKKVLAAYPKLLEKLDQLTFAEQSAFLKDFGNDPEILLKFENSEGVWVDKSCTENGRFGQLPPRKFVGIRLEMDAVISKYKSNGKDWTILRDELNLGATTNLSMEEIYYIRISPNDSRFTFDMPNGNEAGAIPGEWIPTGKTKNGITEAALIGSENCIHNKDITNLLNYFGAGTWEKIK